MVSPMMKHSLQANEGFEEGTYFSDIKFLQCINIKF